MKKQKKFAQNSFDKYLTTEKNLLKSISEETAAQNKQIISNDNKTHSFVESVGTCQLFSVAEAAKFYHEAKAIFGHENAKYVQQKIENSFKLGNRRNLAKAPTKEVIMQLRDNYPNFSEAIDIINGACALSRLSENDYLQMPPLLLLGPPGVGKTAFVQALSRLVDVNFTRIDIGTSSSAAILAGLSLTWGSGRCGEIFNLLSEAEYLNPIVMLDEIDKTLGNHSAPIEPILLSLLEPQSSTTFKDEAIQLKMNAGHIIWIATANYKEQISEPLLSRFTVVEIKKPDQKQAEIIVRNMYKDMKDSKPWGTSFERCLDDEVVLKLSKNTPRVVSKLLQQAFGKAALAHRNKILVEDISITEIKKNKTIGFI